MPSWPLLSPSNDSITPRAKHPLPAAGSRSELDVSSLAGIRCLAVLSISQFPEATVLHNDRKSAQVWGLNPGTQGKGNLPGRAGFAETLPSGTSVPRVSAHVTLMSLQHTSYSREPWAPEGVLAFCCTSHLCPKLTGGRSVSGSKQPQTCWPPTTLLQRGAPGLGPHTPGQGRAKMEGARGWTVPTALPSQFSCFPISVVFNDFVILALTSV